MKGPPVHNNKSAAPCYRNNRYGSAYNGCFRVDVTENTSQYTRSDNLCINFHALEYVDEKKRARACQRMCLKSRHLHFCFFKYGSMANRKMRATTIPIAPSA